MHFVISVIDLIDGLKVEINPLNIHQIQEKHEPQPAKCGFTVHVN